MEKTVIEAALAKELSLTATLADLGMTHRPSTTSQWRKDIVMNGKIVGSFNADQCWEWLRSGCQGIETAPASAESADPLKVISAQMQQQFSKEGIHVEVTFCRADMFSIACLNETDLNTARAVLSRVSNARLDDVEIDGECGAFAYYRF